MTHSPLCRWFGKNSQSNRRHRLLKEVHTHMRKFVGTDSLSLRLDYFPVLELKLIQPILDHGQDAFEEVFDFMKEYDLTKEDWDNVAEIACFEDPLKQIPSTVNTQFTKYLQQHMGILHVSRVHVKGVDVEEPEYIDMSAAEEGVYPEQDIIKEVEESSESEKAEEAEDMTLSEMIKKLPAKKKRSARRREVQPLQGREGRSSAGIQQQSHTKPKCTKFVSFARVG